MKMRRSYILFFFTTVLLLTGVDKALELGALESDYSHFGKVNKALSKGMKPQVAVFGSSVSEVGIDPRVIRDRTGMSCYNYSMDGTRFEQLKGMMEGFLDYSDGCEVAVFVEYLSTFEKSDKIMEMQRYLAHIRNGHVFQSLASIDSELACKARYIPFYRFIVAEHLYYKSAFLGWLNMVRSGGSSDSLDGFTPKSLVWTAEVDSINKMARQINIIIDTGLVRKYHSVVGSFRKRGIRVLIVLPPLQEDGRRIVNGLDQLRGCFKRLESPGVKFLDLSTSSMTADKSFFYNNSHVNDKGAILFSDTVANWVRKLE